MKRVMILGLGNSQKVYDASTDELLHQLSLAIIANRLSLGVFKVPTEPKKPEMTTSEIKKLKDEDIRNFGNAKWREYKEELTIYSARQEEYKSVESCIANNDGNTALNILKSRSYKHGEEMSIVDVNDSF